LYCVAKGWLEQLTRSGARARTQNSCHRRCFELVPDRCAEVECALRGESAEQMAANILLHRYRAPGFWSAAEERESPRHGIRSMPTDPSSALGARTSGVRSPAPSRTSAPADAARRLGRSTTPDTRSRSGSWAARSAQSTVTRDRSPSSGRSALMQRIIAALTLVLGSGAGGATQPPPVGL